jgi:hypothetical protein
MAIAIDAIMAARLSRNITNLQRNRNKTDGFGSQGKYILAGRPSHCPAA